eukprot:CAMPEP_0184350776 /NCGR_PEP_ID=MMETSP1089-20130417/41652_1 /TAXON_ID=38269 ORGANISM="Gloeochaete wittrockiana, Strain SAG46.84" /NCGR_SAMPLE_ID=MMETSP1089 /ASSEMBLY_ACC=CAM_ASM_000445 /LENGTH=118 /DNA_ID=CAMNT_0026683795 /DNA_START=55 /DNA_END=408 /DNA_ORIENTATION=+
MTGERACTTFIRVEGRKRAYIETESALPLQLKRQRSTKYPHLETVFSKDVSFILTLLQQDHPAEELLDKRLLSLVELGILDADMQLLPSLATGVLRNNATLLLAMLDVNMSQAPFLRW